MKFILAILGATAVAMAVTATAGYLVFEPPRGFMFWIAVGFLCFVEFMVGILALNHFSRARCAYQPSGAVVSIVYGIIGAFAISGLASIATYWFVRDADGSQDGVFVAVLIMLTVFWALAAFLLYAYDLHTQASLRPAQEVRVESQSHAKLIAPMISHLRGFKAEDDAMRSRASVALKKLEKVHAGLAHPLGSNQRAKDAGGDEAERLKESLLRIEEIARRFPEAESEVLGELFEQLETAVSAASSSLEAIG